MSLPNIVATVEATFENKLNLSTDVITTQQITAELGQTYGGTGDCKVLYNTTEFWNSRPQLVAKKGYLYIYSNYKQVNGEDVAGVKAGDGTSYLIDMPFIDKPLDVHIADTIAHITSEERAFWNNKVSCFVDPEDEEILVFSTQ